MCLLRALKNQSVTKPRIKEYSTRLRRDRIRRGLRINSLKITVSVYKGCWKYHSSSGEPKCGLTVKKAIEIIWTKKYMVAKPMTLAHRILISLSHLSRAIVKSGV